MTIEEAIRHLKDLSKCESYLWLSDIQAINIAVKALEENAELKRLLKLAVEAIEKISDKNNGICLRSYYCEINECDFDYDKIADVCKWKHKDEAIELLKVK